MLGGREALCVGGEGGLVGGVEGGVVGVVVGAGGDVGCKGDGARGGRCAVDARLDEVGCGGSASGEDGRGERVTARKGRGTTPDRIAAMDPGRGHDGQNRTERDKKKGQTTALLFSSTLYHQPRLQDHPRFRPLVCAGYSHCFIPPVMAALVRSQHVPAPVTRSRNSSRADALSARVARPMCTVSREPTRNHRLRRTASPRPTQQPPPAMVAISDVAHLLQMTPRWPSCQHPCALRSVSATQGP